MPVLEAVSVSKTFGGTRALDGVSFAAWAGQVHALVGENGAGKSTLLRVLGGLISPDEGLVRLDGQPHTFDGPASAQAKGVHVVHQELALLPHLTVAENMLIGAVLTTRGGFLRRRQMRDVAVHALSRLGRRIDVDRRVDGLPTADQQIVEIGRALTRDVRVLILDEPTAALGPADTDRLLALMRDLAEEGLAIVYVTHRIGEVVRVADRVTVLRDGKLVASELPSAGLTADRLIPLMVGRDMVDMFPKRTGPVASDAPVLLSVEHLVLLPMLRDVSFQVRKGEILGIYGLDGNGQNDLMGCLGGKLTPSAGMLRISGRATHLGDPGRLIAAGIGYVPPDRKTDGLMLSSSGVANISLPIVRSRLSRFAMIDGKAEQRVARDAARAADVRGNIGAPASSLSGGNQQKLLLARLLASGTRVLALDQPTRGVDVGAKAEIYALIRQICEQGAAAVVVSQEIPELIGLADQVGVMRQGRLSHPQVAMGLTEEAVLRMAV